MSNRIEIIGLGAGDLDQLPFGIYKKLLKTDLPIFVRTADHPLMSALEAEGVKFTALDYLYEASDQFGEVYENIASALLKKASESSIIYAVPGHPMLAEKTVKLLLEQSDVPVEVIGGQSYLDALFTALQIDPIEGFQIVDGTGFERHDLNYRNHLIFCQVYDRFIASEVKLTLLDDLPPDYRIKLVEAAGTEQEKIIDVPLEELDRNMDVSNLTSVYVPPVPSNMLHHTFTRLREVIAQLRGPDGCPWDKKQTHETLRVYAIEEVYELIEAIDLQDDDGIIEELGDILLQVMLHSQIGADDGYFTVDDVIRSITDKMIHRHPHVFGKGSAETAADVVKSWAALKQEEKGDTRKSLLDGVPVGLPALAAAAKLQDKAASAGFSWDNSADMWAKLQEEMDEVHAAIEKEDEANTIEELGDVLFVLANISRYYKVNPELALNQANRKFRSRFTYIEKQLNEQGKDVFQSSLEEMDYYWNQAKGKE
ncbi:nucleoside triphosphate pyrophosphohydrolase [Virgibacillus siamensis]|uniref:nucleoside triphosphate pyrophosphohydrolase n=1 Tax=Virgibacillus siamensis TaxID=480071 RepID=UPI000986AF94|nr:nucleoside triphosphate pyrophosphohydrolase [Virgibacillus siamensis]